MPLWPESGFDPPMFVESQLLCAERAGRFTQTIPELGGRKLVDVTPQGILLGGLTAGQDTPGLVQLWTGTSEDVRKTKTLVQNWAFLLSGSQE